MKEMTEAQQKFLIETLPAFILREQGAGFAMELWHSNGQPGNITVADDLEREFPSCGTICCIGGSAEILLGIEIDKPESGIAHALGLSRDEGDALFYSWEMSDDWKHHHRWPYDFRQRFYDADSPLEKAAVAAELLKLVGETKGECLHKELEEFTVEE